MLTTPPVRLMLCLIGVCWIGCFSFSHPGVAQVDGVSHMVVLGVDGMSPAGLQRATTPHFNRLIDGGAFSFSARAVLGTSSSQNWASMIMGAGPEQHGVTSNGWQPGSYTIAPTTTGLEPIFPTIFGILRQQRPDAVIAAFYDWGGFGRLFEKSALDMDANPQGPEPPYKPPSTTLRPTGRRSPSSTWTTSTMPCTPTGTAPTPIMPPSNAQTTSSETC